MTKRKTTTRRTTISKDPEKRKRQLAVQFKKGNTASKGFGRPKMSAEEKELSLKTRTQFKTIIQKYMVATYEELEALLEDKTLPVIDGMLIRSLINVFKNGNQMEINWFVDHTLGKSKETTNINVTGSMENTNSIDVKKLSKKELLMLKELAERNDKK